MDLDYETMFRKYQSGDPAERAIVAQYCARDCDLPILLCESKATFVQNIVEMSRVCFTPLPALVDAGQQIKVYSQIAHWAEEWDFLLNFVVIPPAAEGYEGATVLDPVPGYYNVPIATLDFASLYPSIMQAHNLCYSTLVLPEDLNRMLELQRLGKVKMEATITGTGTHYFVHAVQFQGTSSETSRASSRGPTSGQKANEARARRAAQKSTQLETIGVKSVMQFDLRIYGVKAGMMPCYQIASSTTTIGRAMIDATKNAVKRSVTKKSFTATALHSIHRWYCESLVVWKSFVWENLQANLYSSRHPTARRPANSATWTS